MPETFLGVRSPVRICIHNWLDIDWLLSWARKKVACVSHHSIVVLLSRTIFGLGFQKRNHCPQVVSKCCKSCAMKSQQRRFRPLNIFPSCTIRTNDSFPEPLVRIKNQIFIYKLYTITSLRKQKTEMRVALLTAYLPPAALWWTPWPLGRARQTCSLRRPHCSSWCSGRSCGRSRRRMEKLPSGWSQRG